MAWLSSTDVKIWKFFNFYNEEFWIAMSIPITIFVIVSIVLYVKESRKAKEEEREKKKLIKILFTVGIVVGCIEAIVLVNVFIVLSMFAYKPFFVLAGIFIIFSVVSIVRYVIESKKARLEGRPLKTSIVIMFLIAVALCCIIFCIFAKAIFK
ncbi:MAG: hypothetical protein IKU06_02560 [Lachnospiraceae bacterium]|nr:hypothetical protein [Lachnospiraceae bacterium]